MIGKQKKSKALRLSRRWLLLRSPLYSHQELLFQHRVSSLLPAVHRRARKLNITIPLCKRTSLTQEAFPRQSRGFKLSGANQPLIQSQKIGAVRTYHAMWQKTLGETNMPISLATRPCPQERQADCLLSSSRMELTKQKAEKGTRKTSYRGKTDEGFALLCSVILIMAITSVIFSVSGFVRTRMSYAQKLQQSFYENLATKNYEVERLYENN